MRRLNLFIFALLLSAGSIHSQIYRAETYWTGGDACQAIKAAVQAAITPSSTGSGGIVDATYFKGQQACSVDPLGQASGFNPLNVTVKLGAATYSTTVPWNITNSGFHLEGAGRTTTVIKYIGTANIGAVLRVQNLAWSSTNLGASLEGVIVRDLALLGGSGNAVDALAVNSTHRSEFSNISSWGVTGCGIHTYFSVASTLFRPHTSGSEATAYGWTGSTPANGLCLDGTSSAQTTAGTVTDAITEGVSATGWHIINASSMVFTAGTSENNGGSPVGVQVDAPSAYNSFIGSDFEGGATLQVLDNGAATSWRNIIAGNGSGNVFTVGPSAFWTIIENGNMVSVTGNPAQWFRFGIDNVHQQLINVPACGIPGNSYCFMNVTFPRATRSLNYQASCSITGTSSPVHVGSTSGDSTTGFGIYLIADNGVGAGGANLHCLITE